MNEKVIAISALVLLGIAEFIFCFFANQQTQNIGIVVGSLAGLVGNTVISSK